MSRKDQNTDKQKGLTKPHRTRLSRRDFVFGMAALSALASMPAVVSCSVNRTIKDPNGELSESEMATLSAVQNHLFPSSNNRPGAEDVNAASYFTWVLGDTEKDPADRTFMRDGIKWTEETSNELLKSSFVDLDEDAKEQVLQNMAQEGWGEGWLSVVLTLIFEALLSDPIYGANTDERGWRWLNHVSGVPRPTKETMYKS